jgi:hypothetical protein
MAMGDEHGQENDESDGPARQPLAWKAANISHLGNILDPSNLDQTLSCLIHDKFAVFFAELASLPFR